MKKTPIYILLLSVVLACNKPAGTVECNVLPLPQNVELSNKTFTLSRTADVIIEASENDKTILENYIQTAFATFGNEQGNGTVKLIVANNIEGISSPEGYRITITPNEIIVKAESGAGLFYGIQTILQMAGEGNAVPCGTITDEPAFAYRGLMLDVSRHFFDKEFVKKQIDAISHFKMNRLHLHLTDAAGWRIEIKKYPRLTNFAAWRKPGLWKEWWFGDRKYVDEGTEGAYGGYYTQDDIREIVKYAQERYVTIIPEIEMPAHSEETLTAYPELSCTHEPYKQADFCVGNEKTFEFLENVLSEVMELFPSEYIHIGGDEAGKASWPHCSLCQKRMKDENLKNVDELQSYLIHRIEKYVNSKGKQIIGWDEILDGGLAPNATVMSWRGTEGGIAAVNSGHKAIMTPGGYCYLDSYQDAPHTQPMAFGPYMPLEKVYSYNPIEGIDTEKAKLIHGVQGNLWAEYIPTEEMVEYMVYPRILAIAEIGWSNPAERNFEEFRERAVTAVEWLKAKGYNAFDLKNEFGQRKEAKKESDNIAKGKSIVYAEGKLYSDKYDAGGDKALIDGIHGGWTYTDKKWQGFICGGIDIIIDLGEEKEITTVHADFMQMCIPDVWMPAEVTVALSNDNAEFRTVATITHDVVRDEELSFKNFGWETDCPQKARYIRYTAKSGKQGGWLFTDEIEIR